MKWLVKLICPYRLHLKTKPWKYFGHQCTLETKPLDLKVSIQNYSMQFLFPLIGKSWEFKTFPGAWKKGIIVKIATVGATHDSANMIVTSMWNPKRSRIKLCSAVPLLIGGIIYTVLIGGRGWLPEAMTSFFKLLEHADDICLHSQKVIFVKRLWILRKKQADSN